MSELEDDAPAPADVSADLWMFVVLAVIFSAIGFICITADTKGDGARNAGLALFSLAGICLQIPIVALGVSYGVRLRDVNHWRRGYRP